MKAVLMRRASTEFGTPGTLTLDNGWECETLELPWHGNAKGKSCIKAGAYQGTLFHSPHLDRDVIKFDDKNGRGDVEIHNGNFAGDEALGHFTQVHGCILPGSGYADILTPSKGSQWGIQNSRNTLDRLLAQLQGEDLELEIEWQHDVWPDDDA